MAERSKALVLGTSLFGGVGSNPTPIIVKTFFFFCDVENNKNLNVLPCSESSSELAQRKRVGLITQRSQDRNLDSLITSRLAQLVERKTLNLVVVGSSPTVGILFIFYFFARSSKKIKNKNASTGTRTRILTLEGLNTTLVLWTQSLGPL